MSEKYILGLNIGNHDSASALVKNGELVCFIEQERISRNKLALGEAPIDAILECLNNEGITISDISAIAVGMDWEYRNRAYNMTKEEKEKYRMFEDKQWYLPARIFGDNLPPIYSIRHHLAHAASAYRVSGFQECAVLVVDNRGEDSSTSLGVARDGKIDFFKTINIHKGVKGAIIHGKSKKSC